VPKSGRILCLSIREGRRFQLSSAVSLRTGKRSLLVAHEKSLKRLISMDFFNEINGNSVFLPELREKQDDYRKL
jgi:hypothetical protein